MYWTFEPTLGGYLLRSASGKYLTASINCPHVILTPVAEPADGTYAEWGWHDGMLTIDISGTEYVFSYAGGDFLLLSGDGSAACRLYEIG